MVKALDCPPHRSRQRGLQSRLLIRLVQEGLGPFGMECVEQGVARAVGQVVVEHGDIAGGFVEGVVSRPGGERRIGPVAVGFEGLPEYAARVLLSSTISTRKGVRIRLPIRISRTCSTKCLPSMPGM